MFFKQFLDALFPLRCLGCGAIEHNGRAVCARCFAGVELHRTLRCGRCKSRLPDNRKICHRDVPYLLGTAADYNTPIVRALVQGLKFDGIREAATPLADVLIRYVETLSLPDVPTVVVPMPLGRRRQRERGFNQACLIGETFANRFGFPFAPNALVRSRETEPQSKQENLTAREGNIRGCFAVARSEALRAKRVLLVDDVTTSGATFREASAALRQAGPRSIIALAVAEA